MEVVQSNTLVRRTVTEEVEVAAIKKVGSKDLLMEDPLVACLRETAQGIVIIQAQERTIQSVAINKIEEPLTTL